MSAQRLGLRISSLIFAAVCTAHLLRVITQADLQVAGWHVPLWLNIVGILVAGSLSLWMWRLSRPSPR